jgi:hypothetical protein
MILGLGVIVANTYCPWMTDRYTAGGITDFRSLFLMSAGVALAATIVLGLFFHPPALKQTAQS